MQNNKGKPGCVSGHFADTFLEAQKLRVTKQGDKAAKCGNPGTHTVNYNTSIASVATPSPPLCIFNSTSCNIFDNSSPVKDQQAKFGSDRYLTRTYHLQNVATDSQPSIPSSVSDHSSISRHSEPPLRFVPSSQLDKKRGSTLPPKTSAPFKDMDDGRGKSLGKNQSLAMPSHKRKNIFHKDIRRTQSEVQMNKPKSSKPGGGSFGSLKRALSPFIFRKKKNPKQEEETMTGDVMKKITDRDSVHSVPIVMETGFPATSCSDVNREQESAIMNGSACVRGLVSPLVHPRNAINLPSVPRGSLVLEDGSGSVKGESKLTRKRAILSQSGSPCLSAKTSQSNSPAPSLDSVKLKNVPVKSATPTKDLPSDRQDLCAPSPSVESVRIKSMSSTPNSVRQSTISSSPTQTNPLTVNFSGDISHAKKTLVKPKAIKAYQNPTFTPIKRCSECNSPLTPDDPNKSSTSSGQSSNGPDFKVPDEVMVSEGPNITIDSPDEAEEDLDKTMEDGETAVDTRHLARAEMQDLLKRYSPPKQGIQGGATLQRKLKEIKKELEDYKYTDQGNQKIGEIKDKRNSDVMRLSTAGKNQYSDEVFYKTDDEMFNATIIKPAENDYYKEIEVRINPEGIAVVRRRHQFLPETDRSKEVSMRRSTIHVDDRVYCDKAVLQSIYGHSPTHVRSKKVKPTLSVTDSNDRLDPGLKGMKLRSFIHQKSVPNLNENYSDSEDSFTETKNTLVSSDRCAETARLKREYHRSNVTNLPIHKKYIRAYTKFYEQKLALKLLDLNRFIKEEKEQRILLDQRIRKSLLENEELMRELNTAKQDILNMIEVIETPV